MKKISLRRKLMRLISVTSVIPIFVLSFFSYHNISSTIRKNTSELTQNSLMQRSDNLHVWLDSYEDLLYQVYTDDEMVEWVDKINRNEDIPVVKNQMRRFIRGLLNSKDYIRSITIMTENGTVITYDQLTPATYQNSWISNFSMSTAVLYEKVAADYNMYMFSTEYGTTFANEDYYLFHIAHRIVDYRDLEKRSGIVIVSLDEAFLDNICQVADGKSENGSFNFIVDESGRIISYGDSSCIGVQITEGNLTLEERIADYAEFVKEDKGYDPQYTAVYAYRDERLGWDIVNVTNQSGLMRVLERQIRIILLLGVTLYAAAIVIMTGMSTELVTSVRRVVNTMQETRNGNLNVRVWVDDKMSLEIEEIALAFNDMIEKLDMAIQNEKEADERKRKAEILALEAQINPHFLYNTLDTINWMAIDRDEFDISNAINALAMILRYAIADSNREVTVREEIEWLKKYVYLQQFRLKNKFECRIEGSADAMECRIHKLLLQPFVENAIIHGFDGVQIEAVLIVSIEECGEYLKIRICDNGRGMEKEQVENFNRAIFDRQETGHHIGMENAITRFRMYYGTSGRIHIASTPGAGTDIEVWIPLKRSEEKTL